MSSIQLGFLSRSRRFALVTAAVVGLSCLAGAPQQSDVGRKETLADFMQRKLDHAQGVLAGLATRNLPSVAEHADKLGLLCVDEC